MGGCATKPKADTTNSPAPAPVPEKEVSAAAADVKEVAVPLDDANKRQSLSNLLKVEEEKGTTEVAETPTETKTLDEITVSEKATDVSGEEAHKLAKIDMPAEQTSRDVADVDSKIETQVPEEVKTEIPEENKEVTEETPVPVETKVEKAIAVDANTETQKPEESKTEPVEDENIIEETPVADAEKPETETTPETSEDNKAVTLEEEKIATKEIPVEDTKSPESSVEKKTEDAK